MRAAGVFLVMAFVLAGLAVFGGRTLPSRTGAPVEELAVERTVLEPGTITLTMRNSRPDPVRIAQASINDSYVDFTGGDAPIGRLGSGTLTLNYPWITGQPYQVSLLTSTGAVIEYDISAAAPTPPPSGHLLGLMALLGTYVGIIPVLLGLLFLPVLRRAGPGVLRVLLGITVGLLGFLAVDALLEGVELAGRAGDAFGGALLVPLGAGLIVLLLSIVNRGHRSGSPARLAAMIAIGIGLHNLGEGLTIGSAYAVGELALGAGLVVGFAIHNTTEGLAIVAPLTAEPRPWPRLLALGLVAGAPAILGALIGSTVDNATLAALLLGAGAGAIAQVIVQIWPSLREKPGEPLSTSALGGLAGGVVTMYLTGLVVV